MNPVPPRPTTRMLRHASLIQPVVRTIIQNHPKFMSAVKLHLLIHHAQKLSIELNGQPLCAVPEYRGAHLYTPAVTFLCAPGDLIARQYATREAHSGRHHRRPAPHAKPTSSPARTGDPDHDPT